MDKYMCILIVSISEGNLPMVALKADWTQFKTPADVLLCIWYCEFWWQALNRSYPIPYQGLRLKSFQSDHMVDALSYVTCNESVVLSEEGLGATRIC